MSTWIVVGCIAVIIIYAVMIYNGLVTLRNHVKNAFSQIDVQLQRRYDLIPNLVETAKKYMSYERETLEAVIAARNQAQAASQQAVGNPTDTSAMRELIGAEAALGGVLTRFFALTEAYPDLKASQNMAQLQEELASTENRVAFARQAYNDATAVYNTKRESFPDTLIANHFSFMAAEPWAIEEPAARQSVKVNFG